jgi:hypothetical protein
MELLTSYSSINTATNTWILIESPDWSVRSGFPSTNIQNYGMVVSGAGPISGTFYGNFSPQLGTQQFRIVRTRGGTPTVLATANKNVTTTFTDNVLAGDVITMEYLFQIASYRGTSPGVYVEFNPA